MKKVKEPKIFLEHILDSIKGIEGYTEKTTKEKFFKAFLVQDGVIRRLEIIGEAVKNLPMDWRNQYPKIEWKRVAGLRDMLIHEYFGIDMDLIWQIVQKDLPLFKRQIVKLKKEIDRNT